jgi:Uma2 family endonuclease
VTRDREDKFYEYEAAGIPEYWIIDPRPNRRRAYFYQRDDHGHYQPVAPDAAGRYHSRVLPGFWLKPEWLWQEKLPDHLLAAAEMMGPDKLIEFIRHGQQP